MIDIAITTPIIVAAIMIVTKVGRIAGIPSRFLPLLSVVLGMVVGISNALSYDPSLKGIVTNLIAGIILGGSAAGVYDLGKKTIVGK